MSAQLELVGDAVLELLVLVLPEEDEVVEEVEELEVDEVLSVEDFTSVFVSDLFSDFVSDFPPSLVCFPSLNLSE